MIARMDRMEAVSHFLHRHLLGLIVLSYGLAAAFPAPGLWIKDAGIVLDAAGRRRITLPKLLLVAAAFQRRNEGAPVPRRGGSPVARG